MNHTGKLKIPSYLLSLAGEYRVCSELIKRGVFATVTYGNHKGVDVYAISERQERALRIEVKTSQIGHFVTGITQKEFRRDDPAAPDFWVLFQIKAREDESFCERFFVLSHMEIFDVQKTVNRRYAKEYRARRGTDPDFAKGVDKVPLSTVETFEDQWSKIIERFRHGRA